MERSTELTESPAGTVHAANIVWMLVVSMVLSALSKVPAAPARASIVPAHCSLYASPHGRDFQDRRRRLHAGRLGTRANPFASPQRLADALAPGQTGCLRAGSYQLGGELRINHGGRRGAPITLKSYPGERAQLVGGLVFVPSGSNYVTIAQLNINTNATNSVGVQIMGSNTSLIGNSITNYSAHTSCVILGSNAGWGRAVRTMIAGNVIHECGNRADGAQDHAIYFDNTLDATVTGNIIWGTAGFAIHLYQNAQRSQIIHNVIDHNGYGVIFGGSAEFASSGNVVAKNVITNTISGYNVASWWKAASGSRNVLRDNCVYNGRLGNISGTGEGFSAINNVFADPRYTNASRHKYTLRPGSPCLQVVDFDSVRTAQIGSAG
jgi:hypothetical protein